MAQRYLYPGAQTLPHRSRLDRKSGNSGSWKKGSEPRFDLLHPKFLQVSRHRQCPYKLLATRQPTVMGVIRERIALPYSTKLTLSYPLSAPECTLRIRYSVPLWLWPSLLPCMLQNDTSLNQVEVDDKISWWVSLRQNPKAVAWCCYMLLTCITSGCEASPPWYLLDHRANLLL